MGKEALFQMIQVQTQTGNGNESPWTLSPSAFIAIPGSCTYPC